MIPNWNIGPIARSRLDEMAKVGWDDHMICHEGIARGGAFVGVRTIEGDDFVATANTIGLAVAEVYLAWKKYRGET